MIIYKFSYCSRSDDLTISVVDEFDEEFVDSWVESPVFSKILHDVENVAYIGDKMFKSLQTGECFDCTCLSHGAMNLALAEHIEGFVIRFDSLGENLYQYLWELQLSRDIYLAGVLNPFMLAEIKGVTFAEIGLPDFNAVVETSEGFDFYLSKWLDSNPDNQYFVRSSFANERLNTAIELKFIGECKGKVSSISSEMVSHSGLKNGFCLLLKYRVTFIEGESCSGKTRFIKTVNRLNCDSDLKVVVMPSIEKIQLLNPNQRLIVFIDFDDSLQSIDELLRSKVSDNWLFVIVGHHLTSRLKIRFDSIYRIKYLPREQMFYFELYSTPINSKIEYTQIVTEDKGSGAALFNLLELPVKPAGGFGKVVQSVQSCIESGSRVLAVLDYSTAEAPMHKLVELQSRYPGHLNVITPTSAEYCILFASGNSKKYELVYDKVFNMSDDDILHYLTKLGKYSITVETIDLMVFSLLLQTVDIIRLKSFNTIERFKISKDSIYDLIKSELNKMELYNPDSIQALELTERRKSIESSKVSGSLDKILLDLDIPDLDNLTDNTNMFQNDIDV